MERSPPARAVGCHIGAVLDEEPCEIEIPLLRRVMEGSPPKLILGCSVGAVLNKELHKIEMAPF